VNSGCIIWIHRSKKSARRDDVRSSIIGGSTYSVAMRTKIQSCKNSVPQIQSRREGVMDDESGDWLVDGSDGGKCDKQSQCTLKWHISHSFWSKQDVKYGNKQQSLDNQVA